MDRKEKNIEIFTDTLKQIDEMAREFAYSTLHLQRDQAVG